MCSRRGGGEGGGSDDRPILAQISGGQGPPLYPLLEGK